MLVTPNNFNLVNNVVFGKFMKNLRKYRDIKLVSTERRRDYLLSEPNFPTTKFFTEKLLAIVIIKNLNIFEQTCLFRTFNTRMK